jgi:2-oxoglutarate ferredoxin oxidoreductase subunit beta
MIFGKMRDKGLVLDGLKLRVVKIGEDGFGLNDLLVHNASEPDPGIHYMLAHMRYPEYPVAFGIIRSVPGPAYEDDLENQIQYIKEKSSIKCMDDLLNSGNTWEVD